MMSNDFHSENADGRRTDPDSVVVEATLIDGDSSAVRLSASGLVSWIVVAIITLGIVGLVAAGQKETAKEVGGDASRSELVQVELTGKMLVGGKHLPSLAKQWEQDAKGDRKDEVESAESEAAEPAETDAIVDQIQPTLEQLNTGTYEQRLAYVILTREIAGLEQASSELNALTALAEENEFEATETQTQMRDALADSINAALNQDDDSAISEDNAALLRERLGWIGRLAALPENTANVKDREEILTEAAVTTMIYSAASAALVLGLAIGFVLFILAIRRWRKGTLLGRFQNLSLDHNVYIETFALWMVYFFGGQLIAPQIPALADMNPLLLSPLIMFSSLIVLVWPLLRGRSLEQLLKDIGLTDGQPVTSVLLAPVGYLATIPLVVIALTVVFCLLVPTTQSTEVAEFSRGDQISHPIVEFVAEGGPNTFWLVILSACVAAPVVEEVMFRGVLYRHLRDASAHWRRSASVGFSAVLNAFIFAAIHPQGVMLIPVLGALAVGFSLVREWRASLFPCMAMHAIHNGLATCLMFTIL